MARGRNSDVAVRNDNGRWHPGIDIGTLRSLTVSAAAPGVVIDAGVPAGFEGYGNVVVVEVEPGIVTLYAHLSATTVHRGDYVTAGEPIATAGCTGWCSGTHLHFELREEGRPRGPPQVPGPRRDVKFGRAG